jgi:hypothetical protein
MFGSPVNFREAVLSRQDRGGGDFLKITERMLIDTCRRINNEQLRLWDSGLKIERRGAEYLDPPRYKSLLLEIEMLEECFPLNGREFSRRLFAAQI